MTICQALELGINQLNEAGSALYVQHKYNSAVVENFVEDELFGAERKQDLKNMMRAFVKEVQKLSAEARKVVGVTGGPAYSASRRRRRSSRRAPRGGAALGGNNSFPPDFGMPADAPGEQLGAKKKVVCFMYNKKGHFARDCPKNEDNCLGTMLARRSPPGGTNPGTVPLIAVVPREGMILARCQ